MFIILFIQHKHFCCSHSFIIHVLKSLFHFTLFVFLIPTRLYTLSKYYIIIIIILTWVHPRLPASIVRLSFFVWALHGSAWFWLEYGRYFLFQIITFPTSLTWFGSICIDVRHVSRVIRHMFLSILKYVKSQWMRVLQAINIFYGHLEATA